MNAAWQCRLKTTSFFEMTYEGMSEGMRKGVRSWEDALHTGVAASLLAVVERTEQARGC